VKYTSLDEKREFEAFIRRHQTTSRRVDNEVFLWWPERNIENWSGYINSYTVHERRFDTAPAATFGVSLITSLMSERTTEGSSGVNIFKIIGDLINPFRGSPDVLLIRPVAAPTVVNPNDRVGVSPSVSPRGLPPVNSPSAPTIPGSR